MTVPLGKTLSELGQEQRPNSGWQPLPQYTVELPQKLEPLQQGPNAEPSQVVFTPHVPSRVTVLMVEGLEGFLRAPFSMLVRALWS